MGSAKKINKKLITAGRQMLRALLFYLFLSLLHISPLHAEGPGEYQVKAAFIYNFAKFIDWPDSAFARGDSHLLVCAAGGGPGTDALASIEGKPVKNRKIAIRRVNTEDDVSACHMIVVAASEQSQLSEYLKLTNGLPVLTVSDIRDFGNAGGMITLVTVGKRIRFDINNTAARQAHLQIGSQLLTLARSVQ